MNKKTALELVSGIAVLAVLVWLIVWFFDRD